METEKLVEEFFKVRFPEKDIKFEKKCRYFQEWVERFDSGHPENFMDEESLKVWNAMKEFFKRLEQWKKHVKEWDNMRIPFGLSDLAELATKYKTPIPIRFNDNGIPIFEDIREIIKRIMEEQK